MKERKASGTISRLFRTGETLSKAGSLYIDA